MPDEDEIWGPEGPPLPGLNLVPFPRKKKPSKPRPVAKDAITGDERRSAGIETIQIEPGAIDVIATLAEDALIDAGAAIFQRGEMLVRPGKSEFQGSKGQTVIAASLTEVSASALIDMLSQVVSWEKYDGRCFAWVPADPPEAVAKVVLSRIGRWRFKPLAGVISTPTLRPDGTVMDQPGYDARTRLFHVADPGLKMPSMDVTRAGAEKALAELEGLLSGFPLATDTAKAVAVSALITPVVRGCMSVAPLHAFRAPAAGTGKSYLADVSSVIASGRRCPVLPPAADLKEAEARLTGLLLAGFPIISMDNINRELGGDLLCQAVERPLVRLRPLGASKILEVENRSTIFANGNGLHIRGDMTRRTLVADLDAQMERPETRRFESDPVAEVEGDRGRYVGAALTVVRAFLIAGGSHMIDKAPAPLASFEDWSNTVRGALLWLGMADPCLSMHMEQETDPEMDDLRALAIAWNGVLGGEEVTVAAAVQKAQETFMTVEGDSAYVHPELREAIFAVASHKGGNINPRSLANYLKFRRNKVVGDMRFVLGKSHRDGAAQWQVEFIPKKQVEIQ